MNRFRNSLRAAALVVLCAGGPPALAAVPATVEQIVPSVAAVTAGAAPIYELKTEMVVKNWVLCVSQTVAEELVKAREESAEKARSAYAGLKEARACGQFAELRVILQERLYASETGSGHDARIFGALVNFSDDWASAFVVYGGLPEE